MTKEAIRRALERAGLRRNRQRPEWIDPVEFSNADLEVLNYVLDRKLTMASRERVIATINACKHAIRADIEGDFVECGVWRGGNSIAAKLTFENYGSKKKVWLFDTFGGMTAPTKFDTTIFSDVRATDRFEKGKAFGHNDWCFASLSDVRANFLGSGTDLSGVEFVVGDVMETLADEQTIPAAVSVLRLDTDFYDSTKVELQVLYPRVSIGGSLLIDDFGHWDGARQAVEEFLESLPRHRRPLLHFTDYTGRMGVKV
jgi:hypothetical protein